jgi:hypothetical protein
MKAKFTVRECSNAKNLAGDKEVVNEKKLVVTYKGEILTPVDVRWYMGRSSQASTVYCSVWVHGAGVSVSGRGQAGGYGYHKESSAFASALSSAGIELYGNPYGYAHPAEDKSRAHIGGCGDRSVDEAVLALGRALGYRGKMKIV